jgi:hypothetical protein
MHNQSPTEKTALPGKAPKVVSGPYGKLLNGEEHSAASSPALQVGPASPDQHSTASLPDLQVCPALTDLCMTACITAPPLHLRCRLVPLRRTSSPWVIFLRSHKLFVDPAANVFTAIPAAPHKGSGDISAYGTAAVRSASKSTIPRPATASKHLC